MKFSHEKPPVYDRCREVFGPTVDWNKDIVFTYGDTIHSKKPLPESLIVHESVHVRQQTAMGADVWWDRYFIDMSFRLSQEVEAYRAQVEWINKNMKDRNKAFFDKRYIYQLLSSSLYGNMVTPNEAKILVG